MKKILAFVAVLLIALCLFPSVKAQTTSRPFSTIPLKSSSAQNAILSSDPVQAYDEQLAVSLTQNFPSLGCSVPAIVQTDTYSQYPWGPAYLLNGISVSGYWYQVGIVYNWPNANGGYTAGWSFLWEVWDTSQNTVMNVMSFINGVVSNGDIIRIELYFSNGNVVMKAYDQSSGGARQEMNATQIGKVPGFVGTLSSSSNANGYFTGLMTEWIHTEQYYDDETPVTYYNYNFAPSSAWMWIDEFNDTNNLFYGTLFQDSTPSPVSYSNPNLFPALSAYPNATITEYSNANEFITGSLLNYGLLSISTATQDLSIPGVGGTTNPPSGTYAYKSGTNVVVNAIASSGYLFEYWYLDGSYPTSNPLTVSVDTYASYPITLIADFELCATLQISANVTVPNLTFTISDVGTFSKSVNIVLPLGTYQITVSPTYTISHSLNVFVTYTFKQWSNPYGTSATIQVTLNQNTALTAYYYITVTYGKGPTPV